jgi:hypothetical protein
LKFLLAFTRAGFDVQLKLNGLGQLLSRYGCTTVKVRPIQSNLRFFFLLRRHVPLKELVLRLNRSLWGQFLREICPFKKSDPKIGANIGAITGILLTCLLLFTYCIDSIINNEKPVDAPTEVCKFTSSVVSYQPHIN